MDTQEEAEIQAMFFAKKKKKKAKPAQEEEQQQESGIEQDDPEDSYDSMLRKIYDLMGQKEQISALRLKPPKTTRIGSKKTAWTNFRDSCVTMNRLEDHLSSFFTAEFGCLTSITQDGALLIRGVFPSQKIEGLLKKYIELYVKCPMCRCLQTTLQRDPYTRLFMLNCDNCRATRTVEAIKTGFIPTTKADRKKSKSEE